MVNRILKTALVFSAGVFTFIITFNNLTDYASNFAFVAHVLSMDDTFPGNEGMWRAITSKPFHHFFYWIIILSEGAVTVLCLLGSFRLWKNRKDPQAFAQAKSFASLGLGMGVLLWFLGFMAVGGEWFLMWQSETWNGLQSAFRIAALFGIILIYLNQPEAS